MPNLNLGVIDVPYDDREPRKSSRPPKRGKAGKGAKATKAKKSSNTSTTVDVATILEDKYGVMGVFYDQNRDLIAGAIMHGLEGALEDLYAGATVHNPFSGVDQEISEGFRVWLMSGEIETMGVEGVPTQAAIERRSLRFKSRKGPEQRPSFIDTGTYELSFRAWVE
jgi:hypothetical protein